MKVVQFVIGPAGSGKSTYAAKMQEHLIDCKRDVFMVNLDPAAEHFDYRPDIDIRDFIKIEDLMLDEKLTLGPNGALVKCFEYIAENIHLLIEPLESVDYSIVDCPGQIELYGFKSPFHLILNKLSQEGFNPCIIYLMDSQFIVDSCKFIGGVLSALSAMIVFETPHINVLSKTDLLSPQSKEQLEEYINSSPDMLIQEINPRLPLNYRSLNYDLCNLISAYSMVSFFPLNYDDEDSLEDLLSSIDIATMYGEDEEIREPPSEFLNGQ